MIQVTIYKYRIQQMNISGLYMNRSCWICGSRRQDIVCAAVSVLVINTLNSIEQFTDDRDKLCCGREQTEGSLISGLTEKSSHDAELSAEFHDSRIWKRYADDEDYEQYIDITFKEV